MGPKIVGEISRFSNMVNWEIRRLHDCFPVVLDIHETRSPDFKLAGGSWRFLLKLEFVDFKVTYTLTLQKLNCSSTVYRTRLAVKGENIGQIESHWLNEEEAQLQIKPFGFLSAVDEPLTFTCTVCKDPNSEEEINTSVEDFPGVCSSGRRVLSTTRSVDKLIEDFSKLLISKRNCDVVLKVGDRKFDCHRLVLETRSPVFEAMFEHDTSERQNGVVDIEDCDPDTFPDFLHYIYTGRVENLTSDNAVSLYAVSDKYQFLELKEDCLEYLKNNISVKDFCEILILSLRYDETELTGIATKFFLENAAEIVVTTRWQTFLAENTTAGNELIVKLTSQTPPTAVQEKEDGGRGN